MGGGRLFEISLLVAILFSFKDMSVKHIYSLIKVISKVCRFGGRGPTNLGKGRCFFSSPKYPQEQWLPTYIPNTDNLLVTKVCQFLQLSSYTNRIFLILSFSPKALIMLGVTTCILFNFGFG